MEAELDTCRARLHTVEAQLLEVLQEKLRLKQEVEAWEEDMQRMVRERVQSQMQGDSRGALSFSVQKQGTGGMDTTPRVPRLFKEPLLMPRNCRQHP